MKKVLNFKVTIGQLLVICTVIFCAVTATAAAAINVTATISPEITVVYDYKPQEFTDVKGNPVYALSYDGTSYLPVRAVANMLGLAVEYDDLTKTINLTEPRSLMTAANAEFKLSCNTWVLDKSSFPDPRYSAGITCAAHSRVNVNFVLNTLYSKIEFDCYNNGTAALTITVEDTKQGKIIYEAQVMPGETHEVRNVNIAGMTEVRIQTTSTAIILDPVVK